MACRHHAQYQEPLNQEREPGSDGPICTRFAYVDTCAKCRRPQGDVRMISEGMPKEFNGTSWRLMVEHHPYPPFNFKLSKDKTILLPTTYKEETPAP